LWVVLIKTDPHPALRTTRIGDYFLGKALRESRMTEFLFVYGTLMEPPVQQRVFGRVAPGQPDKLVGYRKDQIRLGYDIFYPIIRPEADSSVEGLVIQITPVELRLIDRYEGSAYQRKRVTLVSGRRAWAYQG
jgi:gamma-glutamylcyclotransferase (GGCT)/AIG2-like uncharacterized protein YtfP